MNIIILGQHGSGKSTLAQALAQTLHLPTISTGRMFRDIAALSGGASQTVAAYLATGTYFPDSVVVPLVHERLGQSDVRDGFILEGYPRTLAQAEALNIPVDIVLRLVIADSVSKERLLGRRRSDDTEAAIAKRLDEYHAEAEEVANFYRELHILHDVNAEQSPRHVFDAALRYIEEARDRN